MRQILLATRNRHKIKEIETILSQDGFQFLSPYDFPDMPDVKEDSDTFLGNSMKKAKAAFQHTGFPSLADDSGLEVDYLNGQPGVLSARFAGENVDAFANNQKLLQLLENVPEEKRSARFRCVVAYVDEHSEKWTEGISEGVILLEYRGHQGFGYDPLFYYPPKGKSFAEMSEAEKNSVSHRGTAFQQMAAFLKKILH